MTTTITEMLSVPCTSSYKEVDQPISVETSGSAGDLHFFPILPDIDIARDTRSIIQKINNQELASRTEELLQIIEQSVSILKTAKKDLSNLPPVRIYNHEDGSILVELTSQNLRVGFSLESNSKESGWYLVQASGASQAGASGFLSDKNQEIMVFYLLNLLLSNS